MFVPIYPAVTIVMEMSVHQLIYTDLTIHNRTSILHNPLNIIPLYDAIIKNFQTEIVTWRLSMRYRYVTRIVDVKFFLEYTYAILIINH
jgi:hypothetical protein